jgi:hypothetical protein
MAKDGRGARQDAEPIVFEMKRPPLGWQGVAGAGDVLGFGSGMMTSIPSIPAICRFAVFFNP